MCTSLSEYRDTSVLVSKDIYSLEQGLKKNSGSKIENFEKLKTIKAKSHKTKVKHGKRKTYTSTRF